MVSNPYTVRRKIDFTFNYSIDECIKKLENKINKAEMIAGVKLAGEVTSEKIHIFFTSNSLFANLSDYDQWKGKHPSRLSQFNGKFNIDVSSNTTKLIGEISPYSTGKALLFFSYGTIAATLILIIYFIEDLLDLNNMLGLYLMALLFYVFIFISTTNLIKKDMKRIEDFIKNSIDG